MPYRMFAAAPGAADRLTAGGIPVSGSFADLLARVDIMLDSAPGGVGAKNKEHYVAAGLEGRLPGRGEVRGRRRLLPRLRQLRQGRRQGLPEADLLQHHRPHPGGGLPSTGPSGSTKVAITIIRRVADPGDTHRGLVDTLQIDPIPNHQAKDLMHIMPHVDATGILVHTPVTHGHIITLVASLKRKPTKEKRSRSSGLTRASAWSAWPTASPPTPRSSATPATWATPAATCTRPACGRKPSGFSGDDLMFAINIPQESVVIPETIDAIRAAIPMQTDRAEAVALTNRYLGMG